MYQKLSCICAVSLALFLAATSPAICNETGPLVFASWHSTMAYAKGEKYIVSLENDIRSAIELGVEAFALNSFSGRQAKDYFSEFIQAADAIGARDFKFFLSADMSLELTSQEIVETIETFGDNPHYLKINGKPLLSTFSGGQRGDRWWKDNVLAPLQAAGHPVLFVPAFDRKDPNEIAPTDENWQELIQTFSSVDGLFNFGMPKSLPFRLNDPNIGHHWWSLLDGQESLARSLRSNGKLYMASYMPSYWAVCDSVRQYTETQGGRGMGNAWTSIITEQRPAMVEIVTWNDYAESSFVQPTRVPLTDSAGIPSLPHLGFYELLKYYISWYKSGVRPTIVKDGVFFFHRIHPNNAVALGKPPGCSMGPVRADHKWGKVQDKIYVTTALTAPADLVVRTGASEHKLALPAGLTSVDAPFEPGRPTLELWRAGKKILTLDGDQIAERPDVYNFNVTSGYAIAGGKDSESWAPSDEWKTGFVADWFRQR